MKRNRAFTLIELLVDDDNIYTAMTNNQTGTSYWLNRCRG